MAQSELDWQRLWELFHQTLSLAPPQRRAFMANACGADRELLSELEALVSADEEGTGILDRPPYGETHPSSTAEPRGSLFPTLTRAVTSIVPGMLVGERFEVKRLLGRGGMGAVYEAFDRELGVVVALKTLVPEIASSDTARRRFQREINLARRVTHPCVCRIFDLFVHQAETGVLPFLTMEMLRGQTLAERLRDRPEVSGEEAVRIVTDVAAALEAAHGVGVVHRDLKPGNVMIVESAEGTRAVVTDFGLARGTGAERASQMTEEGAVLGTPSYMAPEQLRGEPTTPATDLYALGLIAFEVVTGTRPHNGSTPISIAMSRLNEPPPPPRELRPDLDSRLEAVILRCLERESRDRFQSATEVIAALSGDVSNGPESRRALSGDRALWAAAAAVILAAAVTTSWMVMRPSAADPSDATPGESAAGQAPARPVPSSSPWVLFTAFENRTDEALFDGTLEYALGRELSNSGGVMVVQPERITDTLALMRRPLNAPIDPALAREVALRDGHIDAVIAGRTDKLGDAYVLSVDLLDPSGGTDLTLTEQTNLASELLPAVHRMAFAIRERLGVQGADLDEDRVELERVTTPSLRALQLYSQGEKVYRERHGPTPASRYDVAEELFRLAIGEDPEFASAYIMLAYSMRYQGKPLEEYLPIAARASELSSRTPPRERLFIRAVYDEWRGEPDLALRRYETLLELYPDHYWGANNLSRMLRARYRYKDDARLMARVADARPNDFSRHFNAALMLTLFARDLDAARPHVERALALLPHKDLEGSDHADAWLALWPSYEHRMKGDLDGAARELDRYLSLPSDRVDPAFAASVARTLGRRALCRELMSKVAQNSPDFLVDAFHEQNREAIARFQGVTWTDRDPESRLKPMSLIILARSGFLESARAGLAEAETEAAATVPHQALLEIVRGELALDEGDYQRAVEHLRSSVAAEFARGGAVSFLGAEALAAAYEAQGLRAEAADLLEQARQLRGSTYPDGYWWLHILGRLIELYRQGGVEGSPTRLASVERELADQLRLADPDHPLRSLLAADSPEETIDR